ncbi:MAG: hypothetical protein JXO72_10190 [Vicinamibacteria bacterium]|nr:hypothetical protein [Vicinamibacteria bacterium]
MTAIYKGLRTALGMTLLFFVVAAVASAGSTSKLVGSWGVDIKKLKQSNPEIKSLSSEKQSEIEKELARLAFTFDEKMVTITDHDGDETSGSYHVVSENDKQVVLEIAQENGPAERLKIRFNDDKHMELVRENDDGALFLVKK